jgi:ribose 5-phosphate isomerase B
MQKISIGNDHAGPVYKAAILQYLDSKGYQVINHGTNTTESVDYPDYAHPVASDVEQNKADFGILICGSGNGVCMAANKHQSIRAALCWNVEIAQLARQHNNANIICIPARFVDLDLCLQMIDAFLNTSFEGGRHENRVNKIACS